MLAGEELAWQALGLLDPEGVCRRTKVSFDPGAQAFRVKFFYQDVDVSLLDKRIFTPARDGQMLKKLSNYANLAILWYLLHAGLRVPGAVLLRGIPDFDCAVRPLSSHFHGQRRRRLG